MTEPTSEYRSEPASQVAPVPLDGISAADLDAMAAAGRVVAECQRALGAAGTSVVAEVLMGREEFFEWDHYPPGDVYDWNSHAQYYYHAHPPENRRDVLPEEHGHFHTFLRRRGMPAGVEPAPLADFRAPEDPNDLLAHFVAISMDRAGQPIRLFTTNRWVTGETWYAAEDVIAMLPRFSVEGTRPHEQVNAWITGLLALFRPDVERLLRRRDEVISWRAAAKPGINVHEDRNSEVLSFVDISVVGRLSELAVVRGAPAS